MRRTNGESKVETHFAFAGTIIPLVLLGGAFVSLGAAIWTRHHTLTAIATWLTLQSLLFFEVRFRLSNEPHSNREQTPTPLPLPRIFGSALALWLLLTASVGLGYHAPIEAPTALQSIVALTILAFFTSFFIFLLRYIKQPSSDPIPHQEGIIAWNRASIWMTGAAFLSSCLIAASTFETQKPIVQTLMFLSLLPVLEWLIRTLISEGSSVSLAEDIRTLRILFTRMNPFQSSFDQLDRKFGVDIRSTWALTFVRRSVARLALVLSILGWLSTSLVAIDTLEAGIHERFGAPISNKPLGPGLHVKAPWPIDRVHRLQTSRVRTMALGFYGPKEGVSLLWTKQHAAEEYNLLLGNGRDLITVNAILQYNIENPWAWHYETQNPEALLRVAAEQALLKNTVNRSLDGVLSENTQVLARQIEQEIRQRVSAYKIGAEIVGLSLHGLHPPVSVAEDYQAVISALHDREISILNSRQYEIEAHQSAKQTALTTIMNAEARAAEILARSRGEAEAFRQIQIAYANAPQPFEQRLRLKALERVLDGRSLNLIDDRIEKDGGVLWFEE